MSAIITDKFNKAADGNGSYPTLATVSATRSASEATLTCQDLTGWATDTPVHFSTYQLNSSGVVDTTTQTDWKGIVSGNTITNLTRIAGAADTGNAIGDIVELNPTIGWLDDLVTGLLASHKQDGSLKDNIVKSNNIDSATIETAKIADSAVTTAKISNSAVTSAKIDWTTFTRFTNIRTNNISISTSESTPTELNSITITTPGVYLLLATAGVTQETSPHVFFYSKFTSSGGTFSPSASGSKPGFCVMTTTAQAERTTMKMEAIISVTGSTTVKSVLWQSDSAAAHVEFQRTLIAIRIG